MKTRRLRKNALPLQNNGALTLIPVGCGTAFSKNLYQNNWLIVQGDHHVMVDCGTRTPQALSERGVAAKDIQTWLITHSHADHIGGLEEVMLMGRYVARSKPRVIITEEYQEMLWHQSLRGGCAHNEDHDGRRLLFDDYWEVLRPEPIPDFPRDGREITVGPINLKLIRTRHYPEQAPTWREAAYSVGLIINDRVLFSGDTQYDPDLISELDTRFHFDYIFHDVQFFTGGIHCSLDELEQQPPDVQQRTLLMHYPDSYPKQVKRVRGHFAGFARQGYAYEIG
jgi:ribonuclease BN (tRNA processing enzyme)